MPAAVVESGNGVGPQDISYRRTAVDPYPVERDAKEPRIACRRGSDHRAGRDQYCRGDRLATGEPGDSALYAMVLVFRGDIGPRRAFERFLGSGDVDIPVLVIEQPVVVAVERREPLDELPVQVVQAVAIEPDTPLRGRRGGGRRAEWSDCVIDRQTDYRDPVAGGRGAAGQRAGLGGDTPGQCPGEEQADVGASRRGGKCWRVE